MSNFHPDLLRKSTQKLPIFLKIFDEVSLPRSIKSLITQKVLILVT